MSRRYPLDALQKVRQQRVDACADAVRDAQNAREKAQEELLSAKRREQGFADEVERSLADEAARADRGEARPVDLARAQAYAEDARKRLERLKLATDAAAHVLNAAARSLDRAVGELKQAEAEATVVERHHERWADEKRRAAESRASDAADDLVAARHGRESR